MKKILKIIVGIFLVCVTVPNIVSAKSLSQPISQGFSGDDVKILQAFLSTDPTIYPEGLITGYYGNLTKNAIKRFQKKYNIEQVGIVGPKTLKKLNELLNSVTLEVKNVPTATVATVSGTSSTSTTTTSVVCYKIPPGHLIAPGWLKKNDGIKQTIPECQTLPTGIEKHLTGGTTTPPKTGDYVIPVISSLSYSASTTFANISWTTNEFSTTKVYFGTTSPVVISTSTLIQVPGLFLSHSISLTGLTSSTTYYLVAMSTDSSGNTASSSQISFTTTSLLGDTVAPIISWMLPYVSSTTATVIWTTNEPATGKLYYATTSPLIPTSNTPIHEANSLSMSQVITLSGLNASTTYYYLIEAKDSSNNVGSSTQQSFTTEN
ncbi:MAG: peptidoglycan-binding protein [Candidatus Paceibacterota bacterium]